MSSKISGKVYQSSGPQNQFKIPGLGNERYWMKIAKNPPDKGKIELWNEEGLQLDSRIGVLDPDTGQWTFNEATGGVGLRKVNGKDVDERKILTEKGNELANPPRTNIPKFIIDRAQQLVVQDELRENPGNVTEARTTAEELVPSNDAVLNSQEENLTNELNNKGTKDSAETRREFGSFVYPETIRQNDQDVIK